MVFVRSWLGVGLVAAMLACSGGETAASCFPGATQPCVCSGARIGAQSCGDDGRHWNYCSCGGSTTTDTDAGTATEHHDDDEHHEGTDAGAADAGPLQPADVTRGATVFSRFCASCHGATGTGTRNGPDIRGETREHSDAQIARIILNGKDDMPPVELTTQEVTDVTAWLRATFGAYQPEH